MTQIWMLEQLLKQYENARKMYKRFPCWLTHRIMCSIYSKIQDMYSKYPSLQHTYNTILCTRKAILDSFNPIGLTLLTKKDAIKHVNILLDSRNSAPSAFRGAYEVVIKKTLRELLLCGHVLFVDTRSEEWKLM